MPKTPTLLASVHTFHPRLASVAAKPSTARLSQHEARLVIEREYGLSSWPRLKAHIETVLAARRTRILLRDVDYHDGRAHGLPAVLPNGTRAVFEQLRP